MEANDGRGELENERKRMMASLKQLQQAYASKCAQLQDAALRLRAFRETSVHFGISPEDLAGCNTEFDLEGGNVTHTVLDLWCSGVESCSVFKDQWVLCVTFRPATKAFLKSPTQDMKRAIASGRARFTITFGIPCEFEDIMLCCTTAIEGSNGVEIRLRQTCECVHFVV